MERKGQSAYVLMILILNAISPYALFGQQNSSLIQNEYLVDTVVLNKPISVSYTHKGAQVGLYMPKSHLETFQIMDDSIFFMGDYLFIPEVNNGCDENRLGTNVDLSDKVSYQEYDVDTLVLVVAIVKQKYYIRKTRSIEGGNLKKILPAKNKFLLVAKPLCN